MAIHHSEIGINGNSSFFSFPFFSFWEKKGREGNGEGFYGTDLKKDGSVG
jgi:hypothetical protein